MDFPPCGSLVLRPRLCTTRGAALGTAPAIGCSGDEMDRDQIRELVLQALETERGGQQVYEAALACARNPALREAWERYRRETARHELVAVRLCLALNVDPEEESPG